MATIKDINLSSIILLLTGLGLTVLNVPFKWPVAFYYLWTGISIVLYFLSAYVLYLGQKFRFFIIYPPVLTVPEHEERTFHVRPWLSEGETRWPIKLHKFIAKVSEPYEPVEVTVHDISYRIRLEKCLKGLTQGKGLNVKCEKQPGLYIIDMNFKEPLKMDVNALISIKIKKPEKVEIVRTPFLEYYINYTLEKKFAKLVHFEISRRVF